MSWMFLRSKHQTVTSRLGLNGGLLRSGEQVANPALHHDGRHSVRVRMLGSNSRPPNVEPALLAKNKTIEVY